MFLEDEHCYAELTRVLATWKVDEATKKEYCITNDFKTCPRFLAKMEFMTKAPTK